MNSCFDQTRKVKIPMESKRISCNCRYAIFVFARLFVLTCLLTYGCRRETSLTQKMSSNHCGPEREMIEHVIGVKLPDSVRNCRYHYKDYGMMHSITWGYFEIAGADVPQLLEASDYLPDAFELDHAGSRFNIEQATQRSGKCPIWWKPTTIRNRRYAGKVIESLGPVWGRQIDICVGKMRGDFVGVYLIYYVG